MKKIISQVLLLSIDILFLILLHYGVVFFYLDEQIVLLKYFWIYFILFLFLFYEKIYTQRFDFWRETKQIYKAVFYTFFTIFTLLSLIQFTEYYSREYLISLFVLLFLTFPFFKRVIKYILFSFDIFKEQVKIVAKGKDKKVLFTEFRKNWYLGYKPALKDYDLLIVNSKNFTTDELTLILNTYSSKVKQIYMIPYLDKFDFSNTQTIDFFNIRISAFKFQNKLLDYKNVLIKELVEKVLTVMIFPFILLIHLVIYTLIKKDSSGKVLFKQKRIGKQGKLFSCYKYRTMYEDNEKMLQEYLEKNPLEVEYYEKYHKYKNDPRVTPIGKILRKTSLDELPQFFNILRGDMNLIGPRPYMINEKSKIESRHLELILSVKPGITGFWQVSGRNNLSFFERNQLDSWYIQNWSLWIDFVIFLKTIKVVLSKVGAK